LLILVKIESKKDLITDTLEGCLVCKVMEDEEILIDSTKIEMKPNNLFFICTNGVTGSLKDDGLEELFNKVPLLKLHKP
jgi:hypothetical protein